MLVQDRTQTKGKTANKSDQKIVIRLNEQPKPTIKFIDLFAGIGGFHLAFHQLGAECVMACEIDDAARKTYQENFKTISPNLFAGDNFPKDVTKLHEAKIPHFNILTAGFPCQPFSQAGFKKGFSEARGTLFFDIARLIDKYKPDAFFLENVRHLEKHDDGKTFATIKKIIEKDLGYSFFPKIVRASDFGLPQHRARLFMVGFKNKEIKFEFPKEIELKMTMGDIFGGECPKRIGYTLRCGGRGSAITDRRNWDSYMVNGSVRRLGIEEGKKMMGLPPDFIFPVTATRAMRQMGNAVAVPAIKATAEQIINSLKKYGYNG